jgi:hypothetical protein
MKERKNEHAFGISEQDSGTRNRVGRCGEWLRYDVPGLREQEVRRQHVDQQVRRMQGRLWCKGQEGRVLRRQVRG